jgi:YidC/Oxa1 family membrane protein insertase
MFFMPKPAAQQAQETAASAPAAQASQNAAAANSAAPAAAVKTSMPSAVIKPFEEKKYVIENSLARVSFSDRGAVAVGYELKKFTAGKDNKEVLELIPNKASYSYLALNQAAGQDLTAVKWKYDGSLIGDNGSIITFSTPLSGGVTAVKKFILDADTYALTTEIIFKNNSKSPAAVKDMQLMWGPNIHLLPSEFQKNKDGMYAFNRIHYPQGRELKKVELKPGAKEDKITNVGTPDYIAIKDLYFMSSFKPADKTTYKNALIKEYKGGFGFIAVNLNDALVEPGAEAVSSFVSYIGPQEYKRLKKFDMERVVDLGWPRFLGLWMFYAMDFFHKLTKNYGVAILLLTLLVRLILWVPSQHSFKQMKDTQKKMTIIKPRIETLKKVYKDDAQKLNEETMKLYQEYKINPLGGCLPMLIQMPIFIALYQMLINMVELKGAYFALWLKDLSKPDPFFVLPIFMGVSMFFQQKMTSTATPVTDETAAMQQKIMLWGMPIFLTFLSFSWPSGLLLYWSMSNVLGIAQQLMVNSKKD